MKCSRVLNILQLLFLFLENDSQMKNQTYVEIAASQEFHLSPVTFHYHYTVSYTRDQDRGGQSQLRQDPAKPNSRHRIALGLLFYQASLGVCFL